MLEINQLQLHHMAKLCELGHSVCVEMKYPAEGLNDVYFTRLWSQFIQSGKSMSLVALDGDEICGFLLGICGEDPYSGQPVAYEQLWYVKPGKAKASIPMLRRFMDDAKARGCVRVFVGDWEPIGGADLRKLYSRFGFKQLEHYYLKEEPCL